MSRSSLPSFLKTLYLFPRNDIPTMIIPVTCLGTCAALSIQITPTDAEMWRETLSRIPQTFLWVWINVLLFSISNQRSEEAMVEDAINKPWRPLPAGRISPSQARRLLLVGIPLVVALCHSYLGAVQETIVCLLLTWMYNDLGGADEHFLIRNGVNSAAYFAYGCGAMRVAGSSSLGSGLNDGGYSWLGIVSAIILSTMHVQDLKDQEGDRARGRSTAPLAIGDIPARWTITVGVLTWSILTPAYWLATVSSSLPGYYIRVMTATIPCILAGIVSVRVLLWRDPHSDTATYKYWSVWLMSIFALPLLKLTY
ncbi:UbiA prenyltransferase family-domain-containing protein [Talaromyces proteolyticus]|uniref:UbiA prenyltransferase family-domain-containing protein n=1 Tax=Talaromyces proteolyticus TaxID=1131652 RepID=A0AAD4KFE2_9EURO|nr:UbiA prenyltransferase family-domain-containing protein [Talaromyces proteolyticus]KAH8690687.1 UbiA prenyltransferase family-domain-containing protein [Talaromyces proteolyticus]